MMVWHLLPLSKRKGFTCPVKGEAASCVADVLIEHWIWCNLYPKHKKNVVNAILKLYAEFKLMVKCQKKKRKKNDREVEGQAFHPVSVAGV